MKFSKKGAVAAVAALVLGTSAAFAEVSFTNKVKSGIVDITFLEKGKGVDVFFSGISERIEAEYTSDKFSFGADGELTLDAQPGPQYIYPDASFTEAYRFMDLKWTDLDFYLEFRPWNFLTIFLSDEIYTPGSYLPVVGFNMGSGNLGSDFGVLVTPINGLRIAAGLDVISYFGGDAKNDKDVWIHTPISEALPKLNIGVDYTYKNMWSVGLVARNILNWTPYKDASIGLFGSFTGVEGWAFYSGLMFNHNYDWYWDVNDQYPNANIVGFIGEYRVEGLFLFDLGLSCWNDKISVDFDLSTNFGANRAYDWDGRYARLGGTELFNDAANTSVAKQYKHFYDRYDLYSGLRGKYQFTKAFSTDITLKGIGDFNARLSRVDNNNDPYKSGNLSPESAFDGRGVVFEMIPTFAYSFGRHKISTGVDVVFTDPYVTISFPTVWTYRF
ncbi:MAG: hypothetical protein II563_07840 [Treponema sp.]|nr:hypothetical protein [Treponema sp.]